MRNLKPETYSIMQPVSTITKDSALVSNLFKAGKEIKYRPHGYKDKGNKRQDVVSSVSVITIPQNSYPGQQKYSSHFPSS